MKYLLAVDLETTGLNPETDEIIQIGAILFDSELNNIGQFESLIKPKRDLKEYITDKFNPFIYSNIDKKKILRAGSINKVLHNFMEFINKKTKEKEHNNLCLLGQNVQFDIAFLNNAFKQENIKWTFDFHNVDLVSAFTIFYLVKFGKLPESVHLKNICEYFNIEGINFHNANDDIIATAAAFKFILNQLKKQVF